MPSAGLAIASRGGFSVTRPVFWLVDVLATVQKTSEVSLAPVAEYR